MNYFSSLEMIKNRKAGACRKSFGLSLEWIFVPVIATAYQSVDYRRAICYTLFFITKYEWTNDMQVDILISDFEMLQCVFNKILLTT